MNLLCPDCHSSVSVDASEPWLHCEACGLKASLSRMETAPGSAPFPLVQDLTGEQLGDYVLEELIGVGGMGVVYKSHRVDKPEGAPVAVKVLNCDYHWQREEFVLRFQREAKALARLDHPNIVTILDSGQVEDRYYLVTEYVDGVSLARYLRTQEPSLREVVELMSQVCGAITYAHEHGVVHRDIKPANVVIAGEQAKVLDFGLAQITGGTTGLSSLTRTDLAMGTINYLSPEQRTNAKRVDERSDVFSLGVVLYEMLTGQVPLGGFEPASRSRPEIGRQGDRIVGRALEANPERRYQSAAALAGDLRQLVQRSSTGRVVALAAMVLAALGLGWGVWTLATPTGGDRAADPVTASLALAPGDQENGAGEDGGVAKQDPASIKPAAANGVETPVQPADDNADSSNVKAPPTRGLPTLVEDSSGRRYPWLGGKGLYRVRKGSRPVAIIDHKGQRWPWPKGAGLKEVLAQWYRGTKGVKRVKGTKGAWRPPVKRPTKKTWSTKGIKGGGKKKAWRPRKGFTKKPPGKGYRYIKGKGWVKLNAFKGGAAPRRVAPARRRPAPRFGPRK